MADARDIPELPRALRAPEPVIIVGMVAWLVATVVVMAKRKLSSTDEVKLRSLQN